MASILITGGAGFIGSHLTAKFVELGHRVRVLDDFSSGRHSNLESVAEKIEVIEGDIRHPEECMRACMSIEYVYHQAAIPSVPRSVEEPQDSHDVNITGTFNMLRAAAHHKVRRFIYAASSSAYGDTDVSPKHEGIPPEPLSPYAAQKLTGEAYTRAFCHCYGIEAISLRYFNVFGERQDPNSQYAAAIPAFVTAILAGRSPTVYGDGEQTRDFTFIDNVVHGNVLAMQATETSGQVVNLACGDQISVNRVIAAINETLGTNVKASYVPMRKGDVMHSCADIRRVKELLGFSPIVSFEEGLQRKIDYYRSIAGNS